jgi:hypothetical protein
VTISYIDLISSYRLPGLVKEVQLNKRNTQHRLDSLPRSFADSPQAMLLNLCNEFTSEIQERVNGTRKPPGFFQDLNTEYHRLAKELANTRPNFEITPNEDDEDDDSRSSSKHDQWKVSKNELPGKKRPLPAYFVDVFYRCYHRGLCEGNY